MNPTIDFQTAIQAIHNSSSKVGDKEREIIIWAFINGVRSVVNGITESENVGRLRKVPISPEMRLVEYGSREQSGNHGFLSAETGATIEEICLTLADLRKHRKIYCKREIRVNLSLLLYLLTQEY